LLCCSKRIKVGKKDLNFGKFLGGPDKFGTVIEQVQSLVLFDWTNLVLLPDIFGEVGQISFKAGQVRWTFLAQPSMTVLSIIFEP
jgi:hypothetical protein